MSASMKQRGERIDGRTGTSKQLNVRGAHHGLGGELIGGYADGQAFGTKASGGGLRKIGRDGATRSGGSVASSGLDARGGQQVVKPSGAGSGGWSDPERWNATNVARSSGLDGGMSGANGEAGGGYVKRAEGGSDLLADRQGFYDEMRKGLVGGEVDGEALRKRAAELRIDPGAARAAWARLEGEVRGREVGDRMSGVVEKAKGGMGKASGGRDLGLAEANDLGLESKGLSKRKPDYGTRGRLEEGLARYEERYGGGDRGWASGVKERREAGEFQAMMQRNLPVPARSNRAGSAPGAGPVKSSVEPAAVKGDPGGVTSAGSVPAAPSAGEREAEWAAYRASLPTGGGEVPWADGGPEETLGEKVSRVASAGTADKALDSVSRAAGSVADAGGKSVGWVDEHVAGPIRRYADKLSGALTDFGSSWSDPDAKASRRRKKRATDSAKRGSRSKSA